MALLNKEQREEYARKHGGLVGTIIKKYIKVFEYPDLLSAGNYGLAQAIMKFDPDRGYKFSTFAMPTIRFAVLHFIRDENRRREKMKFTSIDKEHFISNEGSGVTLHDRIKSDETFDIPVFDIEEDLNSALMGLSDHERYIFSLSFEHGYKQADIAKKIGLSQPHVSRILKKVRKHLREELLM